MTSGHRMCPRCHQHFEESFVLCPNDGRTLFDIDISAHEQVGRTLGGKLEILSVLNQDRYGVLYKARQLSVDRIVAVKVLKSKLTNNSAAVRRYLQTLRTIRDLHHPHMVTLHDFDQTEDGLVYVSMELLKGERLADRLHRQGAMSLEDTAALLSPCCEALQALHGSSLIHRSLTPESIFLVDTPQGDQIKLIDIACAKLSDAVQDANRRPVTAANDCEYRSPEQGGARPLDARVDIYALGIILNECLTGHRPFTGETVDQLREAHQQEMPPPLPSRVPQGIQTLLQTMLAKDPNRRPATTTSVNQQLLDAVTAEQQAQALAARPTLSASPESTPSPNNRDGSFKAIVALTLVLILAAIGLMLLPSDAPAPHPDTSGQTHDFGKGVRIKMAWTPYQDAGVLEQNSRWVRHVLGEALGEPVGLVVGHSYEGTIDLLLNGDVTLASLSPRAYLAARTRAPDLILLARELVGGAATYQSAIVTRTGTAIESLKDLKGKRICFVDPASASGYLYPKLLLRKAGVNPDKDIVALFRRSHTNVARGIKDRICDAGGVASSVLAQWRENSEEKGGAKLLKVLAVSPPIPGDAIVMRANTPQTIAAKIRKGFDHIIETTMRGDQPRDVKSGGYARALDSDYDSLREAALPSQDRANDRKQSPSPRFEPLKSKNGNKSHTR